MRRIQIDIVNACKTLTAREARRGIAALRTQIRRDFSPVWGASAELRYVGPGDRREKGACQLVLLDSRESAQGYHELTSEGAPLGKVFVNEANRWPSGWTGTASHELLELLMDPATTFGVFVEDESLGPRVYSYEICDPVQDDRFAYAIGGVPVSDFVYPSWFEPWHKRGSARFDHAEKLRSPFQVPSGGYAMFYDVRRRRWFDNWGGKVTPRISVYGGMAPPDRGGSRRILHGSPRKNWKKSSR